MGISSLAASEIRIGKRGERGVSGKHGTDRNNMRQTYINISPVDVQVRHFITNMFTSVRNPLRRWLIKGLLTLFGQKMWEVKTIEDFAVSEGLDSNNDRPEPAIQYWSELEKCNARLKVTLSQIVTLPVTRTRNRFCP